MVLASTLESALEDEAVVLDNKAKISNGLVCNLLTLYWPTRVGLSQRASLVNAYGSPVPLDAYDLERTYQKIAHLWMKRHPHASKLTIRTDFEKRLEEELHSISRFRIVPTMLIGRFWIDFFLAAPFFPSGTVPVGKESFVRPYHHGLVLEVDGGVHDLSAKRTKDLSMERLMESLGIRVWRVRNAFVNPKVVEDLVGELRKLNRASSDRHRQLMMKIWLVSIAMCAPDELERLTGFKVQFLRKSLFGDEA